MYFYILYLYTKVSSTITKNKVGYVTIKYDWQPFPTQNKLCRVIYSGLEFSITYVWYRQSFFQLLIISTATLIRFWPSTLHGNGVYHHISHHTHIAHCRPSYRILLAEKCHSHFCH